MKSAQYRAPANDAVENRARFITRPQFHCNSIAQFHSPSSSSSSRSRRFSHFERRRRTLRPRLLHRRRPLPSLRRLAGSPRNNWKIWLAASRCIPIRCLHKS